MKPVELFKKVVSISPPRFGDAMEEHLKDNDELLPHLLMSDLLRYVGDKLTARESRNLIEVEDILAVLETAFTSTRAALGTRTACRAQTANGVATCALTTASSATS